MTKTAFHPTGSSLKATLVAAVLAMAGCSEMMKTPTAQSVAGLSPSGNVTITEDFVTGVGGGSGTLEDLSIHSRRHCCGSRWRA